MDPFAVEPENDKQELIQNWIPFAISLAKNHFRDDSRFDYEERVAEALYALCYAAEKFDASRGHGFGSYAGKVIWDKLKKAAYKRGSLLTRPASWRRKEVVEPRQSPLPDAVVHSKDHWGFRDVENKDLVEWILGLLDEQQSVVAAGVMKGKKQTQIGRKVPRQAKGRGVSRHRVSELKDDIHRLVEAKEWDQLFVYIESNLPECDH